MIRDLTIENFKSYRQATLPLAPLTLLIGANASGKSNLIEAIRFFSWMAQGRRLDDIMEKLQQEGIVIRGTLESLLFDMAQSGTLVLGCTLTNTDEWEHLRIEMLLEDERDMRILAESVRSSSSAVPLYEIKPPGDPFKHEISVAYNNFARGGRKPTVPCSDRQAIFTQLDIPSRFNEGLARETIPDIAAKFQQTLRDILFLDPNPHGMGLYSSIVDNSLRGDGSNLSSVLYDLCEEKKQKEQVLLFIRALPEQDIADIRFLKTPRNEVMVQLVESFAGKKKNRDALVLSDGTLRVLAISAALLSAPEGSLVIIEEIDNGVHPSRAGILLHNIQETAEARKLRVLLTSHNPALLDTLPTEAIPNVVACYRDPQRGDSCLVRLEDMSDYAELVAYGPLGQLMTRGVLDRFLKNQRLSEEKKAEAQDWLASFQAQLEKV